MLGIRFLARLTTSPFFTLQKRCIRVTRIPLYSLKKNFNVEQSSSDDGHILESKHEDYMGKEISLNASNYYNENIKDFTKSIPDWASSITYSKESSQIGFNFRTKKLLNSKNEDVEVIDPVDVVTDGRNIRRTGLIAIKKGVISTWDNEGTFVPLTVLQVIDCQVLDHRVSLNPRKNGRWIPKVAALIGAVDAHDENDVFNKSYISLCKNNKIPCKLFTTYFTVSSNAILPVRTMLKAGHFIPGQLVNIRAVSKYRGFQGVIKRHHFALTDKIGNTKSLRKGGSIGTSTGASKVLRGKRMAGNTGGQSSFTMSRKVFRIDHRLQLIYIHGQVPGEIGAPVNITDSYLKKGQRVPFPIGPVYIQGTPTEISTGKVRGPPPR